MRLPIAMILVLLAWLFLGYGYYDSHEKCCHGDKLGEAHETVPKITEEKPSQLTPEKVVAASGPILYRYGQEGTVLGDGWANYKANLLKDLSADQLMQITGNYTADEKTPKGFINMGEARADEARKALGLEKERVQLRGVLSDTGVLKDGLYKAVSFRNITVNKSIDESIENKTIIRFPFNSVQKLNDKTIETYLKKVAVRVKSSGERVRLTGHTDSQGEVDYNKQLGQNRADIIRRFLMSEGVSKSKILVASKGESNPIADNSTEKGRASNRRTELEIIK